MLQPLLQFLDALGRFPHKNVFSLNAAPDLTDEFWNGAELFSVWSPSQQSPWFPYAKATLFASFDEKKQKPVYLSAGAVSTAFRETLEGQAPLGWPEPGIAVVADLPADKSLQLALIFAEKYRYQPVALFNNWPHSRGLLQPEMIVSAFYALRERIRSAAPWNDPARPPFFMVESGRLGVRNPREEEFDNRYFLSDEDLPGAAYFRKQGIHTVCYIYEKTAEFKDRIDTDDLNSWFVALAKEGLTLRAADIAAPGSPQIFAPVPRKTRLNTMNLFISGGFHRAAAGGFGALVPASSGGG
jgi:hypothetical protein